MRVFVAGGSGVLGRFLVPLLVWRGHEVTATSTNAGKLAVIRDAGAEAIVMDGLNGAAVGEAVARARPEVIINEMTALSMAHAGKPNMKRPDRWFAITNRLRTEGTDHLLAAADAARVQHFVSQGYASWNGEHTGDWVKTEDDPLEMMRGTAAELNMEAIKHADDAVLSAGGAVMRYGALYGPGAIDDQIVLIRKRQYPLVGDAQGYSSWIHLADAAAATVLGAEQRATGAFNIVDDDPAPANQWLPYLAERAGAKPPRRVPVWLARMLAGDQAVAMMTQGRGFSNAKAKRELGWRLRYPSWREGFKSELDNSK